MQSSRWWQSAVFYQIYPRSFADGNGDGIGDFLGLIDKLDYLRDLGVQALWLSPHYPSPNVDVGYDISDYLGVAPEYGTLEDFRRFLDGAHARGIRVLIDLVLNHTSDAHPWFQQSRSSRENPKRDWYVWRDPAPDGGPPNNWRSRFGGPAWTWDETTGQYYYHFFFKEQPDLNWRHPEVKRAMWEVVRFWLDLGVDGFRLDAVSTIFEDPNLTPHQSSLPETEMLTEGRTNRSPEETQAFRQQFELLFRHQTHQPGLHELMKELRALVDEYPGDRVLVGECHKIEFYGNGDDELHLVFNFPLMRTRRLTPAWIRANQAERLAAMPPGAWPCNTLGNHDVGRMKTSYGDGVHDEDLARLHAAMLLTLKGTPVLYYGEEIGMTDWLLDRVEDLRDRQAVHMYRLLIREGVPEREAMRRAAGMSRDRCRTPFQWANAPNAGFSPPQTKTWLPVNPNYAQGVNVADQQSDPRSLLNFYRRLIAARQASPALREGDYTPLLPDDDHCLAFLRTSPEQRCLVALNFSAESLTRNVALNPPASLRTVFTSHQRRATEEDPGHLTLAPFEAYIGEIQPL
jgi:alpha-glucosidase